MSIYDLPKSVEIDGQEWEINSDYRAVLDICIALSDPELNETERAIVVLTIFYPDFEDMDVADYEEALEKEMEFVNCGKKASGKGSSGPKLIDWEQDFNLMIGPINAVAGMEIRALDYLHWWTFISYYNEIDGDSTFAQVVQIRSKLSRGGLKEKSDKEFYSRNRDIIDFKNKYTPEDDKIINEWI